MSTVEGLAAIRTQAFEAARATVENWRTSGRRTTTAGITSALKQAGVIDLTQLELPSNREFWGQAEASGLVRLEQQPNGHWLVLLPGERLSDLTTDVAPDAAAGSSPVSSDADLRLKSEVWTSFVDWNPAFRRFWDRDHSRAFMVPADPDWAPTTVDETRFVEIEAAGQDVQVDWMRFFAEQLTDPDQTAVLISLAEDAPRGAFRRELRERGLSRAWSATLRDHIVGRAATWAREAGIDVSYIVDHRRRDSERGPTTHTDAPARKPISRATPTIPGDRPLTHRKEPSTVSAVSTNRGFRDDDERLALLRNRLHVVIDEMSWDELGRLPIRAEHLIRF